MSKKFQRNHPHSCNLQLELRKSVISGAQSWVRNGGFTLISGEKEKEKNEALSRIKDGSSSSNGDLGKKCSRMLSHSKFPFAVEGIGKQNGNTWCQRCSK